MRWIKGLAGLPITLLFLAFHSISLAQGVLNPASLWPKVSGVATVYYQVVSGSADTANISNAVSTFNADFSGVIQWVNGTGNGTYVQFNLNATDTTGACEITSIGYPLYPPAVVNLGGSGSCTVTTILHEMGHVIGLWHEFVRPDRNSYVSVNYNNVIKGSWTSDFAIDTQNLQVLTPYDYASVMQYPPYTLSRNGAPVIETIPAGMPLQGAEGVPGAGNQDYSAGDKEAIRRLYGAAPTTVTVTSNPVGLQVVVDGATVTTPQTYTWALNSTHTLSVSSNVQKLTGNIENSTTSATFYYTYGRWNDSTSQSHTITVSPGNGSPAFPATSPQTATYSANFIQLVPYTSAVYPSGSGSVSVSPSPQPYTGVTGNFFVARQAATLVAVPNSGYSFYEFNNAPFWLPGGLGANPKEFFVPDTGNPVATTAEFSNTPVYSFKVNPSQTIPSAFSSNLWAYIDNTFWYTPKNFSSYYDGAGWNANTSHTVNLNSGYPEYPYSVNSRFAFSSWTDGGAESHTIASLPAASTIYTATVTPQYAPATNFSYSPCGGAATLSPSSPTGDGFYPIGTQLTYTAAAGSGWTFGGWTFDLSGNTTPASLTADDETLVYANFNTAGSPLAITGISPASVSAGSAAFTLTITGTGFSPATTSHVYFNGNYPAVTYVSPTELQVPISAAWVASPATFDLYVENYPSGSTGCANFAYSTFAVTSSSPETAATPPQFSLTPGAYPDPQTLEITAQTPGASIYLTTDGSTPTTASTLYTGAILVSSSETVKAIAVAPGYSPSSVSSAAYTITSSGSGGSGSTDVPTLPQWLAIAMGVILLGISFLRLRHRDPSAGAEPPSNPTSGPHA
jgi:hypothetical protein